MTFRLLTTLTGAVLIAITAPGLAADKYKIDNTHAWINFSISHNGWSTAMGQFRKISGDIVFDRADVSKSSVKVVIDAASIDTNFTDRDKDLNSPDFLNTSEFPKITFESTNVEKTGERTGKITGNLTIIGVTKPVVLDAVWGAEQPRGWENNAVVSGFNATGVIKPADFGMKASADYGLGPDLNLMLAFEAYKQ